MIITKFFITNRTVSHRADLVYLIKVLKQVFIDYLRKIKENFTQSQLKESINSLAKSSAAICWWLGDINIQLF